MNVSDRTCPRCRRTYVGWAIDHEAERHPDALARFVAEHCGPVTS